MSEYKYTIPLNILKGGKEYERINIYCRQLEVGNEISSENSSYHSRRNRMICIHVIPYIYIYQ